MLNFLSVFTATLFGIAFAGWLVGQVALLTLDDADIELICSGRLFTHSFCKDR